MACAIYNSEAMEAGLQLCQFFALLKRKSIIGIEKNTWPRDFGEKELLPCFITPKLLHQTLEFKDVSQWNHMMQMTANAIQGSDHKSSTLDSNFDQSITISVSPIEI